MILQVYLKKEHGVFVNDIDNKIARFIHKKSEKCLREYNAVNEDDNVDVNIECIWIESEILKTIFKLICNYNIVGEHKFEKFVNRKVCLSFIKSSLSINFRC